MNVLLCPSRQELALFSTGRLEDGSAGEIATHLDVCENCRTVIEEISNSSDPLAASLRHGAPVPFSQEAGYQKALAFVQEIGVDATRSPVAGKLPPGIPASLTAIRDYEILEKLGEGGMGAVYKARHARLKKIVAIKVLPSDRMADESAVARFSREMEAVGKLEHPNLVRAMDAGEQEGMHYLVMEYVPGSDLSKLVRQQGPLPIADACELIRQGALGLQQAHEHGLVHRDIKPSNLILATGGTLKILDMGLALLAGETTMAGRELTTTGQMMGTLDYMAPEQGSSSHTVDIRADIYSLGATLYKLLTGQAPFGGEKYVTPVQKMMALATATPAAVESLRADIPPDLAAIVTKMLARDPNSRFTTPAEVAQVLQFFAKENNVSQLLLDPPSRTQETTTPRSSTTEKHLSNSMTGTQDKPQGRPSFQDGQEPTFPSVKAASLNSTTPAPKTLAARLGKTANFKSADLPLIATALALLLLAGGGVYYGITILIKNKKGEVIGKVELPEGTSADVEQDGKKVSTIPAAETASVLPAKKSKAKNVASLPAGKSPFDALRRTDIPPYELAVAGDGDPAKAPSEIVAILGDSRMRHWSGVSQVAFMGNEKLASASDDGTVKFWDVATGKQEQVLSHPGGSVVSIDISPDSQMLAAGVMSSNHYVRLWSLKTGKVQSDWSGGFAYFSFNADWSRLVINHGLNAALHDPKTREQQRLFEGHKASILCTQLSRDGELLATADADKTLKLWNVTSGELTKTFELASRILGIALSPDGKLLAASTDGEVNIWDLASVKAPNTATYKLPAGNSAGLAFSPDNSTLAYSDSINLILFDLKTQKTRWTTGGSIRQNVVYSIAFSPNGRLIATGKHNGEVQIWEADRGRELPASVGTGHTWEFATLDVSPAGVVAIGDGFRARLWDLPSQKLLHTLGPGDTALDSLAFNPEGSLLATSLLDQKGGNRVSLWDVNQGKLKSSWGEYTYRIQSLAFSSKDHTLAAGDNQGLVTLWELPADETSLPAAGLKPVAHVEVHSGIHGLAFSPPGDLLAVGADNGVSLWNWSEGNQVWSQATDAEGINSLAFHPQGNLLASGGWGQRTGAPTMLWNTTNGEEHRRLKESNWKVWSVAFSPDGRLLATSNDGGEVRLWDVFAEPGRSLLRATISLAVRGHVKRAKFTPDGRHLVTLNGNGTVYVLRLPRKLLE